MAHDDNGDFDRFAPLARHAVDSLLAQRPDVDLIGLYQLADIFYIRVRSLDYRDDSGRTIGEIFNREILTLGSPIVLTTSVPLEAVAVPLRTAEEGLFARGWPRNWEEVSLDFSLWLPSDFPYLELKSEDSVISVLVSRELNEAEQRQLDVAIWRLGLGIRFRVEVRPSTPALKEDQQSSRASRRSAGLFLMPSRRLAIDLPRVLKDRVIEDEDFWRQFFDDGNPYTKTSSSLLPDAFKYRGSSCLVPTTFEPRDLRGHLSAYSQVTLIAPLAKHLESTLHGLRVTRGELLQLIQRGAVRVLFPQSIERYDTGWAAQLAEASSESCLFSRRLAAISLLDQFSLNPLFSLPIDGSERQAILRSLAHIATDVGRQSGESMVARALSKALSRHWTAGAYVLHRRGAMASASGGLAHFAAELAILMFGRDLLIELGGAAMHAEWASAIGADVVSEQSGRYSSAKADDLVFALMSGFSSRGLTTDLAPFKVASDVLVFNDDRDVVRFADEIRQEQPGGLASRLRSSDALEVADIVRSWNARVRRDVHDEAHLGKLSLGGVAFGHLTQPVASLTSVIQPFVPAIVDRSGLSEGVQDALSSWQQLRQVPAVLLRAHLDQ